jgi:hypothetical protein
MHPSLVSFLLLCILTPHNADCSGVPGLVTRADDGRSAPAIRPAVPRLVEDSTIVPRYESASNPEQLLLPFLSCLLLLPS